MKVFKGVSRGVQLDSYRWRMLKAFSTGKEQLMKVAYRMPERGLLVVGIVLHKKRQCSTLPFGLQRHMDLRDLERTQNS